MTWQMENITSMDRRSSALLSSIVEVRSLSSVLGFDGEMEDEGHRGGEKWRKTRPLSASW